MGANCTDTFVLMKVYIHEHLISFVYPDEKVKYIKLKTKM